MLRPSWWNTVILVVSPILMVIGQIKHVDPGVVDGTLSFFDQGFWQAIGGIWGLAGATMATVRALVEGWKRGLSDAGESIINHVRRVYLNKK